MFSKSRFISCTLLSFPKSYCSRGFLTDGVPQILISPYSDPFFNKAIEDHLFKYVQGNVLYLWQNTNTVFIGRTQNPWKECHVVQMEEDGVNLLRRFTGGGAVYQDLGNLCWSIFESAKTHNPKVNLDWICKALPTGAVASGRNDITIDGFKVSGSAFKLARNRNLHHGTLLVDVQLDNLTKYLNVNKEKLISKGIASVRSRVKNLKEIDPTLSVENLSEKLASLWKEKYPTSEITTLTEDKVKTWQERDDFIRTYEQMKDWHWRFGETPKFEHNLEHRFDWGIMDLHLNAKNGIITSAKVFSDSLHPDMVERMSLYLQGVPYSQEGVSLAMDRVAKEAQNSSEYDCIRDYSLWLQANL